MRLVLFVVVAIASLSSSATAQQTGARTSLRVFLGEWQVTSLRGDRASSHWTRTYTVALGDSSVLEWIDRIERDSVIARGFLGRDPRTGLLYYVSVLPSGPPAAITGYPTSDGAIDWRIVPAPESGHPFNRELVSSRLTFSGVDRMDWIAERSAGWHFIFQRAR